MAHNSSQDQDLEINSSAEQREESRRQARREFTTLSNISNVPALTEKTEHRSWRSVLSRKPVPKISSPEEQVHDHKYVNVTTEEGSSDTQPSQKETAEIQNLETPWPLITDDQMRGLGRDFHPPTQFRRLIFSSLKKWLVTGALIGSMVGLIYGFSLYPVMSESDKNIYNFLSIGMSLALGIAIASSLKAMAGDMRWWILSLKKRSLREMDLILRIDSLTACLKLGFVAPRLLGATLSWLILNIGLQVAVAAIGLTYSADSPTDFAKPTSGLVAISDLTTITPSNTFPQQNTTIWSEQFLANSYGVAGQFYQEADVAQLPAPMTLWSSPDKSKTIFYDIDSTYWQYNFFDANPPQGDTSWSDTIIVYTTRNVNVTWSCQSWPVITGGDGSTNNITVLDSSVTNQRTTIVLPFAGALDQTTFITNPNSTSGAWDCGPGCYLVSAFEASVKKPFYYECQMTVGVVGNATTGNATVNEMYQLSDYVRVLAAQSIALQGYYVLRTDRSDVRQYQRYPASSYWGTPMEGNENAMGSLIGRFAIGTIATLDINNPYVTVDGQQPTKGSALTVKWDQLAAIMALIGGIPLLLCIVAAVVSNTVVVKDDSHLAIARTLRPLVERLGPAGCMADGEEIAEVLSDGGETKVVYSVRHPDQGQMHHLEIGVQKRLRAFPRGDYD